MNPVFVRTTLAILLGQAIISYAAPASDEAAVVVTATRFAAPRDRLPLGAQVITTGDIAGSGVISVPEALQKLGGVYLRNNTGDSSPQLDLRGFGITGDQNTLVLLDGIRISENEQTVARISAIPLAAVERIEILSGSGAVLYGAGATGGTINIITRGVHQGSNSAAVGGSIGNFNSRDLHGTVTRAGESVGISLSANNTESDNFRRNNYVREQNIDGEVRGFLDDGDVFLKFGGSRQRLGLPGPLTQAQYENDPRAASTPNDHGSTDTARLVLGSRKDFGFGELAADLAWRNREMEAFYDASGGTSHTGVDAIALTPRLRVPYRLAEKEGSLVFGADLSRGTLRRVINAPLWFWFSDIEAHQNDRAWYINNSTQLAAATQLTLGARWQHSDYDQNQSVAPSSRHDQSRSLHAWEIGLRQGIVGHLDAYGRIDTSFRVANIDDNFTLSGQLLEPQTSRDNELGLEWRQGRDRLRMALYSSRVNNEIHFMAVPGIGFFNGDNVNLPPTRHRGLEVDAAWQATDNLGLRGNYRLTEATFLSGVFSGVDVTSNEVPLVPRHRLVLGADYRLAADWSLTGGLQYIGSQRYDNDQANNYQKMPAYTLADIKLHWRGGDWKFNGGIDNLTDKRYYSYAIRNNAGTSFNAYPEAGRRLTLAAEYAFR